MKFSIKKNKEFSIKNMKFSIKNMKFSFKTIKFSVYESCTYSSFFLFVAEFYNHVFRKNAAFNGKQKHMKPLMLL